MPSQINRGKQPGPSDGPPAAVTGVQLMRGIGARPARGFWAEAWAYVLRRRSAVVSLGWLAVIAFFAVYAPLLASGHPLWMSEKLPGGATRGSSPLWQQLTSLDLVLLLWVTLGLPFVFVGSRRGRAARGWAWLGGLLLAIAVLAIAAVVQTRLEGAAQILAAELRTRAVRTGEEIDRIVPFARQPGAGYIVGGAAAAACLTVLLFLPIGKLRSRLVVAVLAGGLAGWAVGARWQRPLERFDYAMRAEMGAAEATYTLIPWSPFQRFSELSRKQPLSSRHRAIIDDATRSLPIGVALTPDQIAAVEPPLTTALARVEPPVRDAVLQRLRDATGGPAGMTRDQLRGALDAPIPSKFLLGTDKDGADVLSQLLHACRLSISIGLVSSAVALLIGVTIGALMGYFGGLVDLLLYRVVEIFMAVPVLFLLIVAVAVLPEEMKTTYVIMAIIGAFTWTGMARFTRAEFLKLRNQDFVQAAQASGVPLRSILFRHMLPNGVAPVLVDTSFAIAAAISLEATLSYLGLGPSDSASWGKLLSSAISSEGEFKWWLAVFPGGAIFLTVLAYNLMGEALRDAIDPKLKKARV